MSEQSESPSIGAERPQDNLYHFNPEEFDAETEAQIAEYKQRMDALNADGRDPEGNERRSGTWKYVAEDRKVLREWAEKYSGKIPVEWGHKRIEIKNGEPLTDEMIDAAIDHPSLLVRGDLGTKIKLNDAQFDKLLARPNPHGGYTRTDYIDAQEALRKGREFYPRMQGPRRTYSGAPGPKSK